MALLAERKVSRRRALSGVLAVLGVAVVAGGCGGSSPAGSVAASSPSSAPSGSSASSASAGSSASSASAASSASETAGGAPSGTIHVFAAASLTEAFTTLGRQFERAHPGVKVVFNFGASSTLAQQINAGAPADVFASASTKNMDQVVSAGGATGSTAFVKNVMEIAVPPSNPAHVTSLKELAKSSVKVALCQAQVPCGATAQRAFHNAGITVTPVTLEADVKSVLSKVELGEVDAGVVYVTDVRSAGDKVRGVRIPSDTNASTTYPIATLTDSHNATAARAFVSYVLSSAGKAVLAADGFEQPGT
jgi:molybdate transport system substrate-binding protein